MDGKILVLCDEDVTLDEYGNRIGEDEHKNIISCLELDLPEQTENVKNNAIYFVDWKTFMPEDLSYLVSVERVGTGQDQENKEQVLLKALEAKSLMEKSYVDSLETSPRIDYPHVAMNNYFNRFTNLLEQNRISRVLPCHAKKTDESQILARRKVLTSWDYRNKTFLEANGNCITKAVETTVLSEMRYDNFAEIYNRAHDEAFKTIGFPEFANMGDTNDER